MEGAAETGSPTGVKVGAGEKESETRESRAAERIPFALQHLQTSQRRDHYHSVALALQGQRLQQLHVTYELRHRDRQLRVEHLARNTGYAGFGNGTTGNQFRIVLPHEAKMACRQSYALKLWVEVNWW